MNKKIISSAVLGSLLAAGLVFAQTESPLPTPTPVASPSPSASPSREKKANVDRVCIKNAIEKRDSKIIASVDTYASAVKSALTARKDALKAAWDKSDIKEVRVALKAAWDVYKKSVKMLRRVFKNEKNAAWKQFKTDAKACRGQGEDASGEGHDAQL